MSLIFSFLKRSWTYYLFSGLVFLAITLLIFRDFWNIPYLFHDYNFFRDYHYFLNPSTGYRIQPLIYFANYLATNLFHFQPFWPRIFIMVIYLSNFLLALWLMNLITKNKKISFLIVFLFVIYCRSTSMIYTYQAGYLVGLFLTLLLLTLITYIYGLKRKKLIYYILSIIFFTISWGIYEITIMIPVLLMFVEIFLIQHFDIKIYLKRMIPFLIITTLYLIIFVLTTKSLGMYNGGHERLIQREDYFLADFSDSIIRAYYIMVSHFPIVMENSLVSSHKVWLLKIQFPIQLSINILVSFGIIILSSILFFITRIPKEIKFFIASVWMLVIPFSIFEGTGKMDEHYTYVSGLFFIAFLVNLLWFYLKKNLATRIFFVLLILFFAIQNIRLTYMRANQWRYGDQIIKKFSHELKNNFPLRPKSPFFVVDLPFVPYNLGQPANFLYFFYNGNPPNYFYFSYFDESEALKKFLTLKKCESDEYFRRTPIAVRFKDGELINFDLPKEVQKSEIKPDSIVCD